MAYFIAAGPVGIAGYKGLTRSDSVEIKVVKALESFAEDIKELGDLAKNILNIRSMTENISKI